MDGEMNDGQTPAESVPPQPVPPASRLGAVLGWSLPALAVACFIAFVVAGQQTGAAAEAIRRAQAAVVADPRHTAAASAALVAAKTAQWEATLREYLLAGATLLSLFMVPGLLYAGNPALLGGPPGRLLRLQPAVRRVQGEHRQRQQRIVTFYQGVGWALVGVGVASFCSTAALVPNLLSGPAWWLLLVAGLLGVATWSMGLLLVAEGDPVPHWHWQQ
jgi:hypothetical protein